MADPFAGGGDLERAGRGRAAGARWTGAGGRRRGPVGEQLGAGEAAVPAGPVGVEDLDLGPPAGEAVAVLRHEHLGPLADDVAAEPDPGAPPQLEPQAARLGERRAERPRQRRWLEDDEEGPRPPREGGETAERVGMPGGRPPLGQVGHQQVDGAPLEERAGHRQPLVEVARLQDGEPGEVDAARHRLDRVEHPGVEPGDDRAARLRLSGEPQGERRPAARGVAPDGGGRRPREPAETERRVERGEAGRDDRSVRRSRGGRGRLDLREEGRGERALDRDGSDRRDRTPVPQPDRSAPPAGRQSGEGLIEGGRRSVHRHL